MKRTELQRRAPLKPSTTRPRRQPISPASTEQRVFIRDLFCLECGGTPVDPAHIIDRSLLGAGQDDVRAVFPLCRTHHDAYDLHSLDALPLLEQDGWREHLAFAVERYGLVRTLERVSNTRWREAA